MKSITSLSISIGAVGAIWTWLALSPLSGLVLVWAGFLAWACFFHSGADTAALARTLAGNVYGAFVAWITLLILVKGGLAGNALLASLVVGATCFLLVIVAGIKLLSVVPANVYGYAATVAYSLTAASAPGANGAAGTGPLFNLSTFGVANPLILIAVSMVAGALFGFVSAEVAKRLPQTAMAAA